METSTSAALQPSDRQTRQLAWKFAEAERLAALTQDQRDLYSRLARLRAQLALELAVPAYHVLTNRLLLALCEQRPEDLAALQRLEGFGSVRMRAYGAAILVILTSSNK